LLREAYDSFETDLNNLGLEVPKDLTARCQASMLEAFVAEATCKLVAVFTNREITKTDVRRVASATLKRLGVHAATKLGGFDPAGILDARLATRLSKAMLLR
jgi:hypothetical protein